MPSTAPCTQRAPAIRCTLLTAVFAIGESCSSEPSVSSTSWAISPLMTTRRIEAFGATNLSVGPNVVHRPTRAQSGGSSLRRLRLFRVFDGTSAIGPITRPLHIANGGNFSGRSRFRVFRSIGAHRTTANASDRPLPACSSDVCGSGRRSRSALAAVSRFSVT